MPRYPEELIVRPDVVALKADPRGVTRNTSESESSTPSIQREVDAVWKSMNGSYAVDEALLIVRTTLRDVPSSLPRFACSSSIEFGLLVPMPIDSADESVKNMCSIVSDSILKSPPARPCWLNTACPAGPAEPPRKMSAAATVVAPITMSSAPDRSVGYRKVPPSVN